MSEAEEIRDRESRLKAEPGEAPNAADLLTAAAYWLEVERLRGKRRAG